MDLYVELWNTKPAWHALSTGERQEFLNKVAPGMQKLQEAGVEVVGFAVDDGAAPYAAGYRYIAVWKMPDAASRRMLEEAVEAAGWHQYFDQVNAAGELVPPPQALGDMVTHNPAGTS